jgi:hypothetical protein
MNKTLQHLFIESQGKPVLLGDLVVKQGDRIPISSGRVTIRFLSGCDKDRGVRMKLSKGWIQLSDGKHAQTVYTWRTPGLPDEVSYNVSCPEGFLKICNIYRVHHADGLVTEEMWTGNAGIVVLSEQTNKKVYGCSPGGCGEFNPRDLVVELEWEELAVE